MAQVRSAVHPEKPPRRVVFVRQKFTPFGGAELLLDAIISAIAVKGFQVSLIGRSWTGRSDIDFVSCNPSRFPRIWRETKFAEAACEIVRGLGSAIIQSHERMACCDIFRADEGIHAAYIEHRSRSSTALQKLLLNAHPFHRNIFALERKMFASARLKTVIVNSRMVAEELTRLYGFSADKILHIPPGIDLKRFKLDGRATFREETRKRLNADESRPVLLLVGSGYARKGVEAAIRALAKSKSDAQLWTIGSDKKPSAYKALAARLGLGNRVRMIGPVKDTVPYYAAADALILPSIYDPFPSVIIEALACGLPAITSTSCGGKEAVARLDGRLICEAPDHSGLAKAIDLALELASDQSTRSRARSVAEGYSFDAMIDRSVTLYGRLSGA